MIKRLTLPAWDELNTIFAYNDGKLIRKETGEIACITAPSYAYKKVKVNGKRYIQSMRLNQDDAARLTDAKAFPRKMLHALRSSH